MTLGKLCQGESGYGGSERGREGGDDKYRSIWR